MPIIASRHNSLVKRFRALARGRVEGAAGVLLEGEHLIREALRAGLRIETAAVASRVLMRPNGTREAAARELVEEVSAKGGTVVSVSESVMAAMSPVQAPSGIVAIAEFTPPPVETVLNGALPLVAILAGVQDPGNLGAVARAAEAAGATGLIAAEPSADPFSWKALRGAMGSTFRLPVPERLPLHAALLAARRRGLLVAAAVPRDGTPMRRFDFRRPIGLLLGGEGAGLGSDILDHADQRVTIPMAAPVESLNVAVSAAVLLYEASRQRSEGAD